MAVLAAASVAFRSLTEAAAAMVKPRKRVEPKLEWVKTYEEQYGRFQAALRARGYI
jgi:sugar (pentulose or hexulose) kinase